MKSAPRPPRLVACPICKKPTEWSTNNPFRPFCSERCKLIDLGQWATESYRIPDPEIPPDESGASSH
ncbi:MAG: DNA gyrase inhibitor YacG [Sulfuricellaceae bacterium]|nr:DNA gyrase inhibitor YacG [Sulfuricellaceae bacterium]